MPITRDGATIGCHAERGETVVVERTTELAVESAADRAVALMRACVAQRWRHQSRHAVCMR